jgi:hypothetical protein
MSKHLKFYYGEYFKKHDRRRQKYIKHTTNNFFFPQTFKGIFFASRQFGVSGIIKSIFASLSNSSGKEKTIQFFNVPITSNSIFLIRDGRSIILEDVDNTMTKISDVNMNDVEHLVDVSRIIQELRKNGYGNSFVPEYVSYCNFPQQLLVERSILLRERPVPVSQWGEVLRSMIALDMVRFYKESGIVKGDLSDLIVFGINELERLQAPTYVIDELRRIAHMVSSQSFRFYHAVVHGDLQRYNVLMSHGSPYIIDLGGSYRANLFQDLYVQERWAPCPSLWRLERFEEPLPNDACMGWLPIFIEDLNNLCEIKITPIEARIHIYLCFMTQFSRNNVLWNESNHPIVKIMDYKSGANK